MSLQPSSARILPVADADEAGSLVFGGVSIPKAVVAKIWGQVTDGVRLLPRGGAEVGGLLVGPKARESGVVVDGIIPLPIEYKFGPSFRMSASDIAKIPALVEAAQADASKAVVGFYRSRTRGDETLRDSDREIFAAIE